MRNETFPRFVVGDRIGAYRVVGHLVGNSYRAVHVDSGRRVHIEIAAHGEAGWREAAVEMLRALRMVESLSHPGVARIIDRGVLVDRRPWLATEVPSGLGLYDLIARRAMPPNEATALIHDLAAVLAHAHRRGVVHGALTMRSIMLATGTREYPLCITDWGLRVPDLGVYGAPERSGPEAGPLGSMTRGRATGAVLDGRADVYALGVIVYRAVTGTFPGDEPVTDVAGVPAGLAMLITRMLERDPDRRLTSHEVRALASDLLAAGEGDVLAAAIEGGAEPPELLSFAEDPEDPTPQGEDVVHAHGPRFGTPRWTPAPPFGLTTESGPIAVDAPGHTKKPS